MKGLKYLLETLSKLKKEGRPPFKLLILGRDRQNPYLHLAKKIGISEEVVFAGSTDEPEKYYGAADLLVHPTFYDACSLTVLEALASGLPIVTTACNGASGVINLREAGFVISDPRDDKMLAQQITFFSDPEVREKALIAARSLAEGYSLDKNWSQMREIFQKNFQQGLLANRRSHE
jgi:UDP-glucose:(heptosyl)LPS alpha-1,3-glucosyltransferase